METEEIKNEEVLTEEVVETKKEEKKFFKKKENEELIKLKEENAQLSDKVLRLSAEIQNIRRRYDEQISNMAKYEGEELIKNLLVIIDNFERAINMDDTNLEDEVSKFLSGFKMIYANFDNVLTNQGVSQIECLNKDFDPNTMEAVLIDEVPGIEPGKVIDVLQKGYMYRGKIIRHAMVKVSK